MKQLVILRGVQGSGKTSLIETLGWNDFTICPDKIRAMYSSGYTNEMGNKVLKGNRDNGIWNQVREILDYRMRRGMFTVIDATHLTTESIRMYSPYIKKYGYRAYAINMPIPDIDTDKNLKNLSNTEIHDIALNINKHISIRRYGNQNIPIPTLEKAIHRMINNKTNTYFTDINIKANQSMPETIKQIHNILDWRINFSKAKHLYVIGDVHSSYKVLTKLIEDKDMLNPDNQLIFTGDLLDRGIKPIETFEFIRKTINNPNVTYIIGNHDNNMYRLTHDISCGSQQSKETYKLLLDHGYTKKEIGDVFRQFQQVSYINYKNKVNILITHGGISYLNALTELNYIPTNQFISGVGNFDFDIDTQWFNSHKNYLLIHKSIIDSTDNNDIIQVHGHRNSGHISLDECSKLGSYNLEGNVEFGGELRYMDISDEYDDVIHYGSMKNTEFNFDPNDILPTATSFLDNGSTDDILLKPQGNITSVNFTTNAFITKEWNSLTVRARGLFLNNIKKTVSARSYNKFFNLDEMPETSYDTIYDKVEYPINAYDKYDGFLGILGYDTLSDKQLFCSKSIVLRKGETNSEFNASMVKEVLTGVFGDAVLDKIKKYQKAHNVSFVFEILYPDKDKHIIKPNMSSSYDAKLLDIVDNSITYNKLPYDEMLKVAKTLGVGKNHCKALYRTVNNKKDLEKLFADTINNKIHNYPYEGLVFEDANGFMFKLKCSYFQYWKAVKSLVPLLIGCKSKEERKDASVYDRLGYIIAKVKNQSVNLLSDETLSELVSYNTWLLNCSIPLLSRVYNDRAKEVDITELNDRAYFDLHTKQVNDYE